MKYICILKISHLSVSILLLAFAWIQAEEASKYPVRRIDGEAMAFAASHNGEIWGIGALSNTYYLFGKKAKEWEPKRLETDFQVKPYGILTAEDGRVLILWNGEIYNNQWLFTWHDNPDDGPSDAYVFKSEEGVRSSLYLRYLRFWGDSKGRGYFLSLDSASVLRIERDGVQKEFAIKGINYSPHFLEDEHGNIWIKGMSRVSNRVNGSTQPASSAPHLWRINANDKHKEIMLDGIDLGSESTFSSEPSFCIGLNESGSFILGTSKGALYEYNDIDGFKKSPVQPPDSWGVYNISATDDGILLKLNNNNQYMLYHLSDHGSGIIVSDFSRYDLGFSWKRGGFGWLVSGYGSGIWWKQPDKDEILIDWTYGNPEAHANFVYSDGIDLYFGYRRFGPYSGKEKSRFYTAEMQKLATVEHEDTQSSFIAGLKKILTDKNSEFWGVFDRSKLELSSRLEKKAEQYNKRNS